MASVVVAMSGGVDSSVAALLLLRDGHTVTGVTMDTGCMSRDALADASRVAGWLGIRHHVVDLAGDFDTIVLEHFAAEYMAGRTPNPCVVCNRYVKFGILMDHALGLAGADFFATGHYARLCGQDVGATGDAKLARRYLSRAADRAKDQSYVLYALSQEQLAKVRFPLGELTKSAVRQLAAAQGIPVAEKSESQDLCFLSGSGYREFLRARWPAGSEPGPVIDSDGRELGRHAGIAGYTVGQRRGLSLAAPEPLYVVAIKPEERAVVVGPRSQTASSGLLAGDLVWQAIAGLGNAGETLTAQVQIRYRARAAPASICAEGAYARVWFAEPQQAVTPGQAAVFFADDAILGGGRIVGSINI